MTRARHVAVGEIVYQRHRRPAGQHRVQVYLLKRGALVRDVRGGNDLQAGQEGFGVRPAVRLSDGHHDVGALLSTPVTFAEQRAGRAGPRRTGRHGLAVGTASVAHPGPR